MTDNSEKTEMKQWYYSNFEMFEKSLNGQSKLPIHKLRKEAIKKFVELGFPTTTNEEWKYTNIAPMLKYNYKPALLSDKVVLSQSEIEKYLIPGLKVNLFVFVNGFFRQDLSGCEGSLEKIRFENLSKATKNNPDFIRENSIRCNDGFAALNLAFVNEGAVIKVSDGAVIEDPVHILFLTGSSSENLLVQPRNFIFVGKNSSVKVIESTYNISGVSSLLNSVTEIFAGENSNIQYYKIQNDADTSFQVSRTLVNQERASSVTTYTITTGGELIRNDLNTVFNGEGGETNLYGLYLASGKTHIDNHSLIDHAVPHCHSTELYKGILDEKSRGVFNGKVMVRKDAQKTQAYQSNKNLLLSRFAKIDTKPQLEIFADDVKCSHGATVGQLDKEALFYLQSRGIGSEAARSILINAFASDVIDMINIDPLRETLNSYILDKLNRIS